MEQEKWRVALALIVSGKARDEMQDVLGRKDFSESVDAAIELFSDIQKDVVSSYLSGESFEAIGERYGRSRTWAYIKFNFVLNQIDPGCILYGLKYKDRKRSFLEKVKDTSILTRREQGAILRAGIESYERLEELVKSGDLIKLRTVGPKIQASIAEKLHLLKPDE